MDTAYKNRRPLLGRGRFRGSVARVGLLLGAVFMGLILAEFVLRIFGLGYGNTHMQSSAILHHVHTRDHRFISYHRSQEYGGHVVYYDSEGLRAAPEGSIGNEDSPEFVVAFLGDSFVEALQVSYEDSFVGRLQVSAPNTVLTRNYGTSGYGPLLYLLQWRTQIRSTAPTHVFLMLYSNDVRDDKAMAQIATYDERGTVSSISGPEQTWVTRIGRKSNLARLLNMVRLQLMWTWEHRGELRSPPLTAFIEENPDLTSLTDRHLRKLVTEIKQSGAELTLMAVPSKERTVYPQLRQGEPSFPDKVREWASDNGISYIDLTPAFYTAADRGTQVFFWRDIHFTAHAHQLVADVLTEACPKLFSRRPDINRCVTE